MRKHFSLALLVVAALAPALASPAAARPANGAEDDGQGILLGLGDSVAFGYNPLIVAAGKAGNPKNFVGYPEIAAQRLEMRDVNAACPGEASGGFIKLSGPDNGCRTYRNLYPLHVNYSTSQFDYAIKFLKTHENVELITMSIGANDLFLLQKRCNGDPVCEIQGLGPTLDAMQANLSFVYRQIRNKANYQGDIVTVTYYAPNTDSLVAFALSQLNDRLTIVSKAFGGVTADGFGAFKRASAPFGGDPCKAGLLIVTAPGVCDVHPSAKGRDLLAGAVVTAVDNAQVPQSRELARL